MLLTARYDNTTSDITETVELNKNGENKKTKNESNRKIALRTRVRVVH